MSQHVAVELAAQGKGLISNGEKMVEGAVVVSDDIRTIVKLTQAAYDLLTPDANTMYIIVG